MTAMTAGGKVGMRASLLLLPLLLPLVLESRAVDFSSSF